MNTATTKTDFTCRYCEKSFHKETTLAVHVCEQKRRWQEQDEVGVQLGLQAYLRFYEITQGSAKLKTFDDFARSPYYRAFVKFGRYCVAIRAINVARFIEWLIKNNKKIDHWNKDSIYSEYIAQHIRAESITDALSRAIEHSLTWEEETGHPSKDYLRYANSNAVCYAITTGRISPWIIYNCEAGQTFMNNLNQEQINIIWPMIDPDFWQRKFQDYLADQEYVKAMLVKAGW